MTALIVYILFVYGLANIIVNEKIFKLPKSWAIKKTIPSGDGTIKTSFISKLFNCSTCLSFWIGLLFYIIMPLDITGVYLIDAFIMGILTSGTTNIIEHIKIRFGI